MAGKQAYRGLARMEDVIRKVEKEKGERWEAFRDRHGDWGRDLVFWLARRTTGMTLGQVGKKAGGIDYATVGMALRYFEARCQRDKKLLRLREKLKNDFLA